MHPTQHLRERFTDGGLSTASGPKIIVLCYDRLDRDLDGARAAIEAHDVQKAHELLCHAQDLVHELRCMLDLEAWEHASTLSSIYHYVGNLLIEGNTRKAVAPVEEARRLLAELGDSFRQAASSGSIASSVDRTSAIREFSAIA